MAHPFDPDALELTGDAFPIAENVTYLRNWSRSVFSVSKSGVLIYRSGDLSIGSQLVVMNREGEVIDSIDTNNIQYTQRYSPDEQFVVVEINDAANSNTDIWIHDLTRGIKTRFTFDSTFDGAPKWSPDGERIVFTSERSGKPGIYIKNVSGLGSVEMLLENDLDMWPSSWSNDGKYIFLERDDATTGTDMWVIPVDSDEEPYSFIASSFDEYNGVISPDGRWLAYTSEESGSEQVYVTSFPGPGSKWQVSINGGDRPLWREDGKELFYLNKEDEIMVAEVDGSSQTFRAGKVSLLFKTNPSRPGTIYDVSKDGQRFLVNQDLINFAESKVVMIKNWNKNIEN